ncbi:MAG: 4Fe-4S dicluster domain-containing protein [Thermodesulfobacteriaceae bacterium]|nr:4Fe-4S dicluster domain-containing protein [Thermodesulfobacteriaceae bacterium]MCX8042187.1 4Fe-4S dicluster domain-containing protein [Thermodesulfobacteriaceae bacterium]MDW8135674.1 4Fe-4S dicluster domain-containing protein [Thermodesulfobacterium sp.]
MIKRWFKEFKNLGNEEIEKIPDEERREFLKIGLIITGVFAGGSLLSVVSKVAEGLATPEELKNNYPYKPHYSMVFKIDLCIDCERCVEACNLTNQVPDYGWRTMILERYSSKAVDQKRIFLPILCNHCNHPPCVIACPTKATIKDSQTGIVKMVSYKCIGCKTCMTACPYNARYFNEERHAVDKCDFCWEKRLSKGITPTACVEACPAGVRIFGDLSDPLSEVYRLVHQLGKPVWVLKPETGAKPNVFYTIS